MPTLHWIGKEAIVKHHKDVPYRLLEPVAALPCTPSPFKGEPAFGFPASAGAKAPNAGVKGGGEGKSPQILDTDTTSQNQLTENLIVQGDNFHVLKALCFMIKLMLKVAITMIVAGAWIFVMVKDK